MEHRNDIFFGLEHLKYAGVPDVVCDLMNKVCTVSVSSQATFRRHLRRVCQLCPHGYNLLQAVAQINRDKLRFQVLTPPPLHYVENQIKACEERFGLEQAGVLLKEMSALVFCPVCETIYSLLRDFHSVYKADYEYGLRDAVVDYTDGQLYCNGNKVNHIGSCSERPLMRVPLVGELLKFKKKLILLCGQPKCGMPMVFDPQLAMYNQYGYGCFMCTVKARKRRDEVMELIQRSCHPPNIKTGCLLCATEMTLTTQVYVYPLDIWLCKKHHCPRFVELATEAMKRAPDTLTRSTLSQLIVQAHLLRRKKYIERNAAYVKQQLAFHKRRTTFKM